MGNKLMQTLLKAFFCLLLAIPLACAQTFTPGAASNVPLYAYIGTPGTGCINGYNFASKIGRMPDGWVYYSVQTGNQASFRIGFDVQMPAFKNCGLNQNLVVKLALIVGDGSTTFMSFEDVANGTEDAGFFTYAANDLIAAGFTDPIVIPAWEFNAGSYPWSDTYVSLDGGSGTSMMAVLTWNHSTGALLSATACPASGTCIFGGHNYLNTDTGLTPHDGTCPDPPLISITAVNGHGQPTALSVTHQGQCTTLPGPGGFIAAQRHVAALFKAAIPGATIAFDPNCGSGSNGWLQDYPGDDVIDMIGIDCYDYFTSTNVISAGSSLTNGTIAVATQPGTVNKLHVGVFTGSNAFSSGAQISFNYNKLPSGTQTDTFTLPAIAANTFFDAGYTSLPTNHVNGTVSVSSVPASGGKVSIVSDQPPERWNNTCHQTDGLCEVTTFAGGTSNSHCVGNPSPCLSGLNLNSGLFGSTTKQKGLLESGSYTGLNTQGGASLNFGVFGNDDCYWQHQVLTYLGANSYSAYLIFDAPPAITFGTTSNYKLTCLATATVQDLSP